MKNNHKNKIFFGPKDGSQPGEYPFVNGIHSNMYNSRLWTMRQYAGFASSEESNQRYHYLLNQGVRGLSIAFDLPTQTGYDSDHPLSEGEVGKVGVPISSLADMEVLLDKIPLNEVSISMTINSTASILLAFLIAIADKRGIDKKQLRGTIQNDILKEYISRGTYIYPPKESMYIITNIFEYCEKNLPNWNTISISGYHMREAGSTAIQELAFTMSNGIEYVQAAIDAGMDVNSFGRRISFFFNSHNNFFEEIAKFRAARKIWANIMKNRFGVTDKKAMMCRFHTQTAGSTLTAQQIDNNIVRTTLQATASILGGTQSLHTNSKDEALSLPTEESARLALRTQQIIAHESNIPEIVDPLAGSFYIESLTQSIEINTNKLIKKIDEMGGAVSAIENKFQQNQIANSAYEFQKKLEKGDDVIVGVNKYKSENSSIETIQHINIDSLKKQILKLKKLRETRNYTDVKKSLNNLKMAIPDKNKNFMPYIIDAVKNYATLGEISDVFRSEFGEYQS